jgi:hypothetical protein
MDKLMIDILAPVGPFKTRVIMRDGKQVGHMRRIPNNDGWLVTSLISQPWKSILKKSLMSNTKQFFSVNEAIEEIEKVFK